ncbi:hypothetical protein, partial [Escherichia coli]|uniref:hypothetical protein n=1 Tax=Escherichia coli TaxID=562 RepID=UPI0019D0520D
EKWSHFLPEFIADLPLVARHTSPSKIAIIFDLTIPFGIGSKYSYHRKRDYCHFHIFVSYRILMVSFYL